MSPDVTSPVLVVSGSRAFTDAVDAQAWALEQLAEVFYVLPDHGVVVTGDARGPDTWIAQHAHARMFRLAAAWGANPARLALAAGRLVEYRLDGNIWTTFLEVRADGMPFRLTTIRPWATPEELATMRRQRRWPLLRDGVMVTHAARAAAVGRPVVVLALKAPWSRTDGTGFTARHAAKLELWTDLRTCPAEHGERR